MAYEDLTPEQQTMLDEWLTLVRPMLGELGRLVYRFSVAQDAYNSHVGDIFALLAGSDEVPNASGLAGAATVLKSEMVTVLTDAADLVTTFDTDEKRQLMTKFAGAASLIVPQG